MTESGCVDSVNEGQYVHRMRVIMWQIEEMVLSRGGDGQRWSVVDSAELRDRVGHGDEQVGEKRWFRDAFNTGCC